MLISSGLLPCRRQRPRSAASAGCRGGARQHFGRRQETGLSRGGDKEAPGELRAGEPVSPRGSAGGMLSWNTFVGLDQSDRCPRRRVVADTCVSSRSPALEGLRFTSALRISPGRDRRQTRRFRPEFAPALVVSSESRGFPGLDHPRHAHPPWSSSCRGNERGRRPEPGDGGEECGLRRGGDRSESVSGLRRAGPGEGGAGPEGGVREATAAARALVERADEVVEPAVVDAVQIEGELDSSVSDLRVGHRV